ncbi:hypothetical protein [Paraburkholderia hospita]|uniref:hypothetical protein n=1 Tax=Paraburkholderia hospita TaxID=169430 RepID=UPI000DF01CE7|nr:hypothetical protein [Paraburkholderia hospita]AXF05504.1 hypothetical protein CUJ88_44180 [Paraburkholderia hospita]
MLRDDLYRTASKALIDLLSKVDIDRRILILALGMLAMGTDNFVRVATFLSSSLTGFVAWSLSLGAASAEATPSAVGENSAAANPAGLPLAITVFALVAWR